MEVSYELWRSYSSPLIYKDTVICPHGKENIDTTEEGRMIAVKIPETIDFKSEQKVLPKGAELWSCLLYTSPSPRDLSTSRMPSSA